MAQPTPTRHVIVGAGPIGSALARQLVAAGHHVTVVTRTGGPSRCGETRVALDASDGDRLAAVAEGAAVLYNAANPADYHRWPEAWPPLAASLRAAAERSGAVLATVGNLYAYGPVDRAMTEDLPLAATYTNGRIRAQMTREAFAAHEAGRLQAVEVVASDYVGRGAYSHVNIAAESVLAGRTARVIGDPDQPHTWTGTEDTARTLVAAAADPTSYGRLWHVPSNPPRTQREALTDLADVAGVPKPKVAGTPRSLLRVVGLVNKQMGAMLGTYYQFDRPFVMDDSAARAHFALPHTPWRELLADSVDGIRTRTSATAA